MTKTQKRALLIADFGTSKTGIMIIQLGVISIFTLLIIGGMILLYPFFALDDLDFIRKPMEVIIPFNVILTGLFIAWIINVTISELVRWISSHSGWLLSFSKSQRDKLEQGDSWNRIMVNPFLRIFVLGVFISVGLSLGNVPAFLSGYGLNEASLYEPLDFFGTILFRISLCSLVLYILVKWSSLLYLDIMKAMRLKAESYRRKRKYGVQLSMKF